MLAWFHFEKVVGNNFILILVSSDLGEVRRVGSCLLTKGVNATETPPPRCRSTTPKLLGTLPFGGLFRTDGTAPGVVGSGTSVSPHTSWSVGTRAAQTGAPHAIISRPVKVLNGLPLLALLASLMTVHI